MNNPGQLMLWLGLIALAISSTGYLVLLSKREAQTGATAARLGFIAFATVTTIASMLLMHYILTHNFLYSYVVRYSSKDLSLLYLISSFWAGQEGSFLLWVLLGGWLGILLMYRAQDMEPEVMLIYNLNNIFLIILLIKQSPFHMVPLPPADGNGLNMLLQDPWMAIHPPIVFLGYAAYTIPFAYAMAALWRRDYDRWIKPALPWAVFAFVTLGAGIIIGGYWSYKVLGWGGYWGWDPVENASLLPWLSGTALMHGMILQDTRKKLRKTNFFLASFSFLLVIYCTFLTRSGVLASFSVHSFTDLGITGWLIVFMVVFIAVSSWLLVTRAKDIPETKTKKSFSYFSREFGFVAAMLLLLLSCVVTGLGTSAPLITRLLENASKVSTQFYVDTNLPIAVLMLFLVSVVPLMTWGQNSVDKLSRKLVWALLGALVSGVVTIANGYPGIRIVALALFAGAAIGMNLQLALKLLRKKVTLASGAVAHLGLGLMFIGIIASCVYDRSEKVSLTQGISKDVLGYNVVFTEPRMLPEPRGSRLKLPLEIKKGGLDFVAVPDIRTERLGREPKRFTHPHIRRGILSDLYIAPLDFKPGGRPAASANSVVVKKGQTITFHGYELTFTAFDVSGMMASKGTHDMKVGAKITVSRQGGESVELEPVITVGQLHSPSSRVKLPGSDNAYLILAGIDAGNKAIRIDYEGPDGESAETPEPSRHSMIAEISIKPGMTPLWLGTLLVLIGGCIGIVRRSGK